MANKIADARRSLIRAKESAEQRLVEIDEERREIRTSLKSLDAAIKALGRSNKCVTSTAPVCAFQLAPTNSAGTPTVPMPRVTYMDDPS